MRYCELPGIVHTRAKQVIKASKLSYGNLGCYTLDDSVSGVRYTSRGLLCIRLIIHTNLIGIINGKKIITSKGASHYEYALPARAYLYWLKNRIQLDSSAGKNRNILVPTVCKNPRCVNPSHQQILPYNSNLYELVIGQKTTEGIQGKSKKVTKITVESVTHSFTSLEQLQHQKDLDNSFSGAVDVTHTVIDL